MGDVFFQQVLNTQTTLLDLSDLPLSKSNLSNVIPCQYRRSIKINCLNIGLNYDSYAYDLSSFQDIDFHCVLFNPMALFIAK